MGTRRLRVLCLDVEGGYGGSSRSLYEGIRHMDRTRLDAEVWCKKAGPIQARYEAAGIPVRVAPRMPRVSSVPQLSRNFLVYALFLRDWALAGEVRRELLNAVKSVDLVHCNHEGLFLLGRWLKRRTGVPLTIHVRTNLLDTPFARWQERTIARTADEIVFISENERANFERLAGRGADGTVIFNPVAVPPEPANRHPDIPDDGRFRIVCTSSKYSYQRGTDRVVDLAAVLAARGRRDIALVIAGEMALQRSLPGVLGRIARNGGSMADYAEHRGVTDMVQFLGFVPNPEQVLEAGDVLFKPTREWNAGNLGHPWGRDILEAMAAAMPVLSIGRYDRFVETGVTGVLQTQFDAETLADEVVRLADDPALVARMGATARERVAKICHAPARAADLHSLWSRAAGSA